MTSSLADPAELRDHIRPLGLQSIRARRLIALSAAYTYSCGYHDHDQNLDHDPEQPAPISHLPGSGPYALDSYRIYCGGPDAWRTVMPRDKELIRFIVRLSYCRPPIDEADLFRLILEVALGRPWGAMVPHIWGNGSRK